MESYYGNEVATVSACNWCGKIFSSIGNLRQHEFIHTGEKPHKCHLCPKSFTQKGILTRHLITHSGEKAFLCHFCDRSYSLKGNLTSHLKSHMRERLRQNGMKGGDITHYMETGSYKPFSCHVCGKSFSAKGNVANHVRIHMKPKDKWYTSELAKQIEREIGMKDEVVEKRLSCDTCGKRFFHQHNLLRHQRGHESEDKISCKLCKNTFTHETFLKRHMRVHAEEDLNANSEVTEDHYAKDGLKSDMSTGVENCIYDNISEDIVTSESSDNNNKPNFNYPDCDIPIEIKEQFEEKSELSNNSLHKFKGSDPDFPHDISKHSGHTGSNLTSSIISGNLKSRLKDNKLVIQRVRTCNTKPAIDTCPTPSADEKSTESEHSLAKEKKHIGGQDKKEAHVYNNVAEADVSLKSRLIIKPVKRKSETVEAVENNFNEAGRNVPVLGKRSGKERKNEENPSKKYIKSDDFEHNVAHIDVRRSGRNRKKVDLESRDNIIVSSKSNTQIVDTQPKSKSGRPSKPILDTEDDNRNKSHTLIVDTKHKSKRGRPLKRQSAREDNDSNTSYTHAVETPHKKRGRPPKPKTDLEDNDSNTAHTHAVETPHKKRGRPPKPKADIEDNDCNTSDNQPVEIPLKNKSGRLPKPGVNIEDNDSNTSDNQAVEIQRKNKSGRLPKPGVNIEDNDSNTSDNQAVEIQRKNKSGRLPKPGVNIEDNDENINKKNKLQDHVELFEDVEKYMNVTGNAISNMSDTKNKNGTGGETYQNTEKHSNTGTGKTLKITVRLKSESKPRVFKGDGDSGEKDSGYECELENDLDRDSHINKQFSTSNDSTNCDKPFVCSVCKKAFKFKCALNLHMGSHTGSKHYKCNKCKQSFQLHMALKMHMMTHN